MSTTVKNKKIKASDMFFLAALAFLALLAYPIFRSIVLEKFYLGGFAWTLVIRAACIAIWIFSGLGLVKMAKKECGLSLFENNKPTKLEWILTSALAAAFVAYLIIANFNLYAANVLGLVNAHNIILAITREIFNLFKACILTLIITFTQKGFDAIFKFGNKIPFGGIVLGIFWVIMALLASDVALMWQTWVGLLAYGIVLGLIYTLSGEKTKYALPFIAVIYVLIGMLDVEILIR